MAKFKENDQVDTKYGPGVVTYVTPAEKLQGTPQSYHVECKNGSTYDFDEAELTAAKPAAPAKAAEPAEKVAT